MSEVEELKAQIAQLQANEEGLLEEVAVLSRVRVGQDRELVALKEHGGKLLVCFEAVRKERDLLQEGIGRALTMLPYHSPVRAVLDKALDAGLAVPR